MKRILLSLIILSANMLMPAKSIASGFYTPPDIGTIGLSKAGANIAFPKDLSSIWYNPAGLANISQYQFTLGLNRATLNLDYTRSCPCVVGKPEQDTAIEEKFSKVSNENSGTIIPFIAAGIPTPIQNLHLGFGMYVPNLALAKYPEDGAQRYSLIEQKFEVLHFQLAAGYHLVDQLDIGAGVVLIMNKVMVRQASDSADGLLFYLEEGLSDSIVKMESQRKIFPAFSLGATYHIISSLDFGVSFLSSVNSNTNATLTFEKLPDFDKLKIIGDQATQSVHYPMIFRSGLQYKTFPYILELAYVIEFWSNVKEFTVIPDGIKLTGLPFGGDKTLEPIHNKRNWQNSHSLRLGFDYSIIDTLSVRLGYAYETSAIPPKRLDVFAIDANKHALAMGFTYRFHQMFSLDLAGIIVLYPDMTITDSEATLVNAYNPDYISTIGNGKYEPSSYVLSSSVNIILPE